MSKIKLCIGISGKMGSGKTTLTNGIIKTLKSLNSEVISLAKPIKDVQDLVYDKLDMRMEGEKDRPLLIALGLWGRDKDPDFWLNQAVKIIDGLDANLIICDDVRFPNEADWFSKNGILLRLEGKQRGNNINPEFANNISETALDHYAFDNYINNEGGIMPTLNTALYCIAQKLEVSANIMEKLVEETYGKK